MHDLPQVVHNYSYFPVFVDEQVFGLSRDGLYERLKAHGIFGCRYFYPLISSFPLYEHLSSANPDNLPVSNHIAQQVLCLPIDADLGAETAARIAEMVAAPSSKRTARGGHLEPGRIRATECRNHSNTRWEFVQDWKTR